MAKGDEKVLAQLQRYASPEVVWQKARALETKLSSGEFKPVLGKNATAEEVKAYREAHGIPDKPEAYDLGKDLKIDDADQPLVDLLKKVGHASNQTPDQVKSTVKALKAVQQQMQEQRDLADTQLKQTCDDALRGEWGGEFRRNVNLIHGLLDLTGGGSGMREAVLDARMPDGRRLGDTPEAMRLLLNVALVQNPAGIVVPGGNGEKGEGIKGELEKLQKIPAGKKTEAQSTRERDLIDAAVKAGHMDATGAWKA